MKLLSILAVSVAITLACPTAARARIGETEGQSQVRYGAPREDLLGPQDKPLLTGSVEKQFLFEGFRVRAAFADGKCVVIEYAHVPDNGILQQFTDAEVKAILVAESGLDEQKLAGVPKEKQAETALRRWREEKIKEQGAAGDIAKGIKGAFKLNKWQRADGAVAEYALGLVLKITDRTADDWARKYAREAKKQPVTPGKGPTVPKF